MDDGRPVSLPLVSVITVNYDQPEVTCELLRSLNEITYPSIEIIVVDNASPTRSPDMITKRFPEVKLIISKKNLGFAGGNNLGILEAKGSYLLLINNDTEVEPGFLEPLVQKLELDPTIGAVSPKIRYFYQKDTLQFAGFTPMNPVTIRNEGIGFNEKDKGQYDEDRETSFAFGAAMLLPVNIVKKVGMMADIFFLYYEELDWFQRIRDAGYRIMYVHNSIVYHKDSITTGRLSPLKIYYLNRGRVLFMRRNIHGSTALLSIIYQMFVAVPKNLTVFLLKGQFSLFKAYAKAMGWHLKNSFNPELHHSPYLNT